MVTASELREQMAYDPETGHLFWRKSGRGRRMGVPAGCIDGKGYICVFVNGRLRRAHRLCWLYVYGVWPADQIDHIDNNRRNNAIANLREANNAQNNCNRPLQINNSSGVRGVRRHRNKFEANIKHNGKWQYIGLFPTLEAAKEARDGAALALFGQFARIE